MKIINASAEELNGIGSVIERAVRADYSEKVAGRVLEHADVNGPEGVMFMAGFEACRTILLVDIASVKTAAESVMLFHEAAWKESLQMDGRSVKEAMCEVMDAVIEAAEEKVGEHECDCPKCRAIREVEGE